MVLTPLAVACFSVVVRLCPRGGSWLSGASPDSCQGRLWPARCRSSSPGHPQHGDKGRGRGDPGDDQVAGQLAASHHDGEDRHHQPGFQDQHQRRGPVGQGVPAAHSERVQGDQHDRLQRDAAEQVAHGDTDVARHRRADGDGDLRQVRRDRQHDEPAQGRAEVQPLGQHVGLVGQLHPGHPDRRCRHDEDPQQQRQRETRHRCSSPLEEPDGTPPAATVPRPRTTKREPGPVPVGRGPVRRTDAASLRSVAAWRPGGLRTVACRRRPAGPGLGRCGSPESRRPWG